MQPTFVYRPTWTARELNTKAATKLDGNRAEKSDLISSKCLTDRLGLPDHVSKQCDVNGSSRGDGSSSSCARLTCDNILNDIVAADDNKRIAAEFMKSHPVHIPSDEELASIGANCVQWHKFYGFDKLPPVSADEEDFPIAFNILAHRGAHQVL